MKSRSIKSSKLSWKHDLGKHDLGKQSSGVLVGISAFEGGCNLLLPWVAVRMCAGLKGMGTKLGLGTSAF